MSIAADICVSASQMTDRELVCACQSGEAAAWEMLVERYQRLVYSIPRRAGLSEELAADVFQQVFATLVERIHCIEQPERIGAWLATTARREAWRISRQRTTQWSHASLDTEEQQREIPDGLPLPDEILLQMEEQHALRTTVAALAEPCRTIVTLLFYRHDPPSYEQLAATLGTAVGSIGPMRARCLLKLRQVLRNMGYCAAGE